MNRNHDIKMTKRKIKITEKFPYKIKYSQLLKTYVMIQVSYTEQQKAQVNNEKVDKK